MRPGRLSFFAAASWLVPFFVFIVLLARANDFTATEHARGHVSWGLPLGFGRFIFAVVVTAGLAFSLGLVSFLRRERLRWVAAIPCLAGGLFVSAGVVMALEVISRPAVRAIQRSPDLAVGILLALIGVSCLVRHSVKVSARLAQEQAGETDENDARSSMKTMKLFGIVTLTVGIGWILIYAFELL